eukprot:m.439297 g.439297  ORF g.439297 m.439297 type:complete len:94 (-) comp21449_c0_seq2:108-389(-)
MNCSVKKECQWAAHQKHANIELLHMDIASQSMLVAAGRGPTCNPLGTESTRNLLQQNALVGPLSLARSDSFDSIEKYEQNVLVVTNNAPALIP